MAKKATRKKPATPQFKSSRHAPGVISDHESYNFAELERRFGIGRDTIRRMKARGLPVLPLGKTRVIRGAALNQYLAELEESVS